MDLTLATERPDHIPADRVVDFDMYAPPGVADDFHAAWTRLQAPGLPSVVWTPRNGGHWIATRNRVIGEVMGDYARFSSNFTIIPKAAGADCKLLPTQVDPPIHRPYRLLLNSTLSPKSVNRLMPRIREIAVALIEAVRGEGRCNFTTAYAEVFPIQIFLSIADLPLDHAPMMKEWSDQMLRPTPGRDFGPDKTGFAWGVRKFFDYLSPVIAERRAKGGDDVMSQILHGELGGREPNEEEALQLCAQILIAGFDTVVNFLGFAMLHLARTPEHRRELAARPELIPAAVEEMIRRFPIVTIGREVVRDTEYEGVLLKAGEMVATPTPLGGIDDQEHACPMEVDFRRPSGEHTTFGSGSHRCPGAHLARTEIQITLEEWLARIPDFEVEPGREVHYTGGIVAVVDALPLVWDAAARAPASQPAR